MTEDAPKRISRLTVPDADKLAMWLPLLAGLAYLLVLVINQGNVVAGVYGNADAASAPVVATLLERTPDMQSTVLGNYPWYESLWFLRATEDFPYQRQIWQGAPIALYFLTVALVAGATWSVLGRWAAIVATAVLIALGPLARSVFFAPNFHGTTAAHAALLGATLVLLARRREAWRAWQLVAIGVVLGVITALGVASDELMLPAAIGPAAGTAALLWWKVPRLRGAALSVIGACVLALFVGDMLEQRVLDSGIRPLPYDTRFLAGDQVFERAEGLVRATVSLAGADIFNLKPDAVGLGRLLALVLLAAGLWLIAGELRRRIRVPDALRRAAELTPAQTGLLAHAGFWALSAIGTIAVYTLGNLPLGEPAGRYLVTVWLALGALLGLLAIRPGARRVAISAGAALFVAAATVALAREAGDQPPGIVSRQEINGLARYAKAMNVDHGLANYWSSSNVTWATRFELELLAVRECNQAGRRFCPINLHRVDSAYIPRGGRSMLVVDDRFLGLVGGPDPGHGRPLASKRIGGLQVYVYRYDLRERLGPA